MKTVAFSFRVDEDLKSQAEKLFSDLGLSMSGAINIFLTQAVREQKIPFEITKHIPNKETINAIDDANSNENIEGPFDNVDELFEALDN